MFLVDDHAVIRAGLVSLLGSEADLRLVGEASDAESALERISESNPDVIIVDYRLPGMDGISLCREIAERRLPGNVVMLSAQGDQETVHAAFRAGARGYVVKGVDAGELKRAVRLAARGEVLIDPKTGVSAVGGRANDARTPLRPSERRILALLCRGKTTEQIADAAGLSHHTVKDALSQVYMKLGVGNRTQAVAEAMRQGIV